MPAMAARQIDGIVIAEDLRPAPASYEEEEEEDLDGSEEGARCTFKPSMKFVPAQGAGEEQPHPKSKKLREAEKQVFQKTNAIRLENQAVSTPPSASISLAGPQKAAKRPLSKAKQRAISKLLLEAAHNGDVAPFASHLAHISDGMTLSFTDEYGWNVLMIAAAAGHSSLTLWLLEHVPRIQLDLTRTDAKGRSFLQLAEAAGMHELLEEIQPALAKLHTHDESESKREDEDEREAEIEPWVCTTCQQTIREPRNVHEASILHNFAQQHPTRNQPFQLTAANRGYQLLRSAGWDEYSGLGKKQDGRRAPVKTEKKDNRHGIGVEQSRARDKASVRSSGHEQGPTKRGKKEHIKRVEEQAVREKQIRHILS